MIQPAANVGLNALSPYFTMFPLGFPLGILRRRANESDVVLDPFAGRGTTNYAARLLGLRSTGIDSSPVAVALTQAKLANTTPAEIVECAQRIIGGLDHEIVEVPAGEFWDLAFDRRTLTTLCGLRDSLLSSCETDARRALRGLLMGALHGPLAKGMPRYFSNQCTRTYAPKPAYAVRFWRQHHLRAPSVDVLALIRLRAHRYFSDQRPVRGVAISGDSRVPDTFGDVPWNAKWVITSPPYYGMRTYIPDQWLRHWFVGGPSTVDYTNARQMNHVSPDAFSEQLRRVWANVARVSTDDAVLVVRYGGISDRRAHPLEILKGSFRDSPWRLKTLVAAGTADYGKRQAAQFAGKRGSPRIEHDAWLSRR